MDVVLRGRNVPRRSRRRVATQRSMQAQPRSAKSKAIRFVVLIGIVSFFADFAYEGARSVNGPFLAALGASAAMVGFIAGFGELMGYAFRLISGPLSERTGQFWPITLFGYFVQMSAVPLLAWAPNWQTAGGLIIAERMGRAIRNPPRDVMLSHASKEIGYGRGFGLHEALDQLGAMAGPLVVAVVLAHRGSYRSAFAVLLVPAVLTLILILSARMLYPKPVDLETTLHSAEADELPGVFWLYLAGAALVAAGFADFSLITYHFHNFSVVPNTWIPVFYSVAMVMSGLGSLTFGHIFDRVGFGVLIPLTLISTVAIPLVFFGRFWLALLGAAIWGVGTGVHESLIPAAVALMVPTQRRPSAYGIFTAGYGVAWFIGSVVIGKLYGFSIAWVVIFSVTAQLIAVPVFLIARNRMATELH